VAACVAVVAVLVPATAASAADPPIAITINPSCVLFTGTETVTYTVTTPLASSVFVELIGLEPAAASMDHNDALIRAGVSATFVETIPPGAKTARVKFRVANGGVFTEVSSEVLTFACGEAFFTSIAVTRQCAAATGITTITYTLTPRPGSRLAGDVIAVRPAAPTSTVTPTQIRTLEPSGQFVQTIPAGLGTARLTLKLQVKVLVIIGHKAGPSHPVNVDTPTVVYSCP
jgi:hypothetical protein